MIAERLGSDKPRHARTQPSDQPRAIYGDVGQYLLTPFGVDP